MTEQLSLSYRCVCINAYTQPGGGHDNPLHYSCLENPQGQRSLVGCSPWGCKESDGTERLSACTHTHTHTPFSMNPIQKGAAEQPAQAVPHLRLGPQPTGGHRRHVCEQAGTPRWSWSVMRTQGRLCLFLLPLLLVVRFPGKFRSFLSNHTHTPRRKGGWRNGLHSLCLMDQSLNIWMTEFQNATASLCLNSGEKISLKLVLTGNKLEEEFWE